MMHATPLHEFKLSSVVYRTILSFIMSYRQLKKHILYTHNIRNIHYKTRNEKRETWQ